jgi:hypothetical protein
MAMTAACRTRAGPGSTSARPACGSRAASPSSAVFRMSEFKASQERACEETHSQNREDRTAKHARRSK